MREALVETINYQPLDARRSEILSLVTSPISTQIYSGFSITKPLPVIRIHTSNLVYRIDNGRTRSQQAAWAAKNGHNRSWFTENTEDQTRQRQQHLFLWDLAQRSAGSEGISIYEALKSTKVQTNELLITADGVLVNGNRRLATMRELVAESRDTYREYEYATCAVLPPETSSIDVRLLELSVQMAPETKLKYSWINDALTYRSFEEDGYTPEQIAEGSRSGIKARAISQRLATLNEADIYLNSYLGAPLDYDRLEKAETAFKNLAAATQGYGPGPLTDKARAVAHVLISQADALGERVYSYIQPLKDAKHLSRVFEILIQQNEIVVGDGSETASTENSGDDLFEDLDSEEAVSDDDALVRFIADPTNVDAVKSPIQRAAKEMLDERKQGNIEEKPFKIVSKALGDLQPFGSDDVFPEYAEGIRTQAKELIAKLETLIEGAESHLESED